MRRPSFLIRERRTFASFSARIPPLAVFLFVLLTALSTAVSFANDNEGRALLPERAAGSLEIRPGKDADAEPLRLEFAVETVKESTLSDETIAESAALSVPEGADHPVVDVFSEDTPSGRARGNEIATRIRNSYRKIFGPKKRIDVEVVSVPEVLTEFKKGLSKPTTKDFRTGALIGTYSGTTAFATFYSTPGVSLPMALGLTAFQFVKSSFHAVFSSSISRTFRLNLVKPGEKINGWTLFARRQTYSVLIAELTRYVTGRTPTGFDPLGTWSGQAQIITMTLGLSALDNILFDVREKAFLSSPKNFANMYLFTYILLAPWQSMDSLGTFPVLLDLNLYKIRASTFGMLATYTALYSALRYSPNKVATLLDLIFDPMDKVLARAHQFVGRTCGDLLDRARDLSQSFRKLIQ